MTILLSQQNQEKSKCWSNKSGTHHSTVSAGNNNGAQSLQPAQQALLKKHYLRLRTHNIHQNLGKWTGQALSGEQPVPAVQMQAPLHNFDEGQVTSIRLL